MGYRIHFLDSNQKDGIGLVFRVGLPHRYRYHWLTVGSDTSTALHFRMALRHRARSVYSLSLPQEMALDESNPVPVISPLDKEYLAWLGNTTSNLWPLIRIHDDQLAQHILEQNFNPAITASGRILGDRSALTSLCGKYGPLGHDTTFALVSETAWVASYRVSRRVSVLPAQPNTNPNSNTTSSKAPTQCFWTTSHMHLLWCVPSHT